LRAEKDIVFGKGGDLGLTLDVYHPPEGVTPKRMAIIHLFGGGFFVGNKNAGYIINDAKALGNRGYTSVSANYRLQSQSLWPAQIHDVKAAIRWTRANAAKIGVDADKIVVAGYSAGGMLALLAAGTNDKPEFEGSVGTPGVSSKVNACISVYPLASAQIARGLFGEGGATPEALRPHRRRATSARASRRRSSSMAKPTRRCRSRRASTSSRSSKRPTCRRP
jgi:acetyl esterase/lipase